MCANRNEEKKAKLSHEQAIMIVCSLVDFSFVCSMFVKFSTFRPIFEGCIVVGTKKKLPNNFEEKFGNSTIEMSMTNIKWFYKQSE